MVVFIVNKYISDCFRVNKYQLDGILYVLSSCFVFTEITNKIVSFKYSQFVLYTSPTNYTILHSFFKNYLH